MATVIITGGTGLIGVALSKALLLKGYRVVVFTRNVKKMQQLPGVEYMYWDAQSNNINRAVLQEATAIIHLAGAGIAEKRWTQKRKREIVDSRVQTARSIVQALLQYPHNITKVISASGTGYYGPDRTSAGMEIAFREDDAPYTDFIATTCVQWENALSPLPEKGIQVVTLRTGMVLSKEGGAVQEFLKPLKLGIAPVMGNGRQVISWIHIDDLVVLYIMALENASINGAYNAVAPEPVNNNVFIKRLAKNVKDRKFIAITVPSFLLKLVLGELSNELLKSITVSSNKVLHTGFKFSFPDIDSALEDILR